MDSLKYSLRLMLCWPVLAMLGGILFVFVALALLISLFVASMTWQGGLWLGFKYGGIFVCALWAMFFIKTLSAVGANGGEMLTRKQPGGASQVAANDAPADKPGASTPDKPAE